MHSPDDRTDVEAGWAQLAQLEAVLRQSLVALTAIATASAAHPRRHSDLHRVAIPAAVLGLISGGRGTFTIGPPFRVLQGLLAPPNAQQPPVGRRNRNSRVGGIDSLVCETLFGHVVVTVALDHDLERIDRVAGSDDESVRVGVGGAVFTERQ